MGSLAPSQPTSFCADQPPPSLWLSRPFETHALPLGLESKTLAFLLAWSWLQKEISSGNPSTPSLITMTALSDVKT